MAKKPKTAAPPPPPPAPPAPPRPDLRDILELMPRGKVRIAPHLRPAVECYLAAVIERWELVADRLAVIPQADITNYERSHLAWLEHAIAAGRYLHQTISESVSVTVIGEKIDRWNAENAMTIDGDTQRLLPNGHVVVYPDRG